MQPVSAKHVTPSLKYCSLSCSKDRKLLKSMKFPKEYSLKIDVTKVNWEIMKEWTAQRVTQLLGMEDEVLIGYIHEQLGADKKVLMLYALFSVSGWFLPPQGLLQDLDPKMLQIGLTGFLEKNTSLFIKVSCHVPCVTHIKGHPSRSAIAQAFMSCEGLTMLQLNSLHLC